MEAKIYTPDEAVFVYAYNLEQAKEVFEEEMGYLPEDSDWQEWTTNYVAHAEEIIGIGGYSTYEFDDFIRWGKIQVPYVFTDMKDELERLY